jgi:cell division protein FtsZ
MKYSIEAPSTNHAIIKVIGIGGGGCNAVNRMIELNLAGIDFVASNTDLQALSNCRAPKTIPLGANLTRGLGAGGNPKIGREAALEDDETIRSLLDGADMVFITAGMGGGTGTGGAPVIAQIAKELGALTIAVVTKPFRFEGRRRMEIADAGIRDLEDFVDTLITIPNQKLLATVEQNTTLKEAFVLADEVLCQAVQGISDLITVPGLINLDFADVKTIMSDMGKALMGTGSGTGSNKAIDAVRKAIDSPLLEDLTVQGAKGILINLTGGNDLTLMETDAAAQLIHEVCDPEANIIFGAVIANDYDNQAKATVIATGFDSAKVRKDSFAFERLSQKRTFPVSDNSKIEPVDSSGSIQKEHTQEPVPSTPAMETVSPVPVMKNNEDTVAGPLECSSESEVEDPGPQDSTKPSSTREWEDTKPGLEIPSQRIDPALQPELALDSNTQEEPTSSQADDQDITEPDSSEVEDTQSETADIHPFRTLPQPELELKENSAGTNNEKLPLYTRRDLGSGQFKRQPELDKGTISVESSNYMIPAFLRRKAD